MADKLKIINMALIQNGAEPLLSLTQDTINQRRANGIYNEVRDTVLAGHPWNRCTKRAQLSLLSETPAYGYTYMFQLPTDCLRVLRSDADLGEKRCWVVEDDKLLTDEGTIAIQYIFRNENVAHYSPGLVIALSARLEAELCYAITAKPDLARAKFEIYEDVKLPEAKGMDAQEGTAEVLDDNDLHNSRRSC